MGTVDVSEPTFTEWQRLTDAYAKAIVEMENGKPGAAERVSSLCKRLVYVQNKLSSLFGSLSAQRQLH
ncbi:hypothetical protein [Variovorax sp. KK3]|uniref:hypothetical protein n=1 Tax=Variovorax sp. KK3 TaxID=1855728 RepID=UPI00097C20AA|nr:hypothetical protein [Variovorax sp. KK3]